MCERLEALGFRCYDMADPLFAPGTTAACGRWIFISAGRTPSRLGTSSIDDFPPETLGG